MHNSTDLTVDDTFIPFEGLKNRNKSSEEPKPRPLYSQGVSCSGAKTISHDREVGLDKHRFPLEGSEPQISVLASAISHSAKPERQSKLKIPEVQDSSRVTHKRSVQASRERVGRNCAGRANKIPLNTDFAVGKKARSDNYKDELWKTQKKALEDKFGDAGWAPRKKLSPDALEGIRTLHANYPDKWTTPVLANQFEVSPEAIRRILKSKWRPNEIEEEGRRERWNRRGRTIWSHKAELGLKPPRKWRRQGIGKDQVPLHKRRGGQYERTSLATLDQSLGPMGAASEPPESRPLSERIL